jgi:hypothetical protein
VWREARGSAEKQTPSPAHGAESTVRAAAGYGSIAKQPGAPPASASIVNRNMTLDSAGVSRLTREVFGRIEQKLRIERERRGY